MALSGYLWPRRAHNIMGYRSERDKPFIENMMGTVRRVARNVKRWRNPAMARRWTAAGMLEARKGFRLLKAYKQLPVLKAALAAHQAKHAAHNEVEPDSKAA